MSMIYFLNQKGQSLAGTLVSVAIMGIAILGMSSMFQHYGKEMRAINEKLSTLSLEKSLIGTFGDGSVCTFMLTNNGAWLPTGVSVPLTFNANNIGTTTPPTIGLQKILLNAAADAPSAIEVNAPASLGSNSAVVKSISIMSITGPVGGDTFSATLQVIFDSDRLVRSISPVYIPVTLHTNGPSNNKTILNCSGVTSSTPNMADRWLCNSTTLPGGNPYFTYGCVRITDGQTCYTTGNGNWNCAANITGWPGDDPSWKCNVIGSPNQPGAGYACARTSDGMICLNGFTSSWGCSSAQGNSWPQ
jgi:hypothetical protein